MTQLSEGSLSSHRTASNLGTLYLPPPNETVSTLFSLEIVHLFLEMEPEWLR